MYVWFLLPRIQMVKIRRTFPIQGLKSIANILLAAESLPSIDENGTVTDPVQTNMTIFGLTDFVIQADELFDTNDLSAQQYATLLNAIFSGHSSVQSLFDLYHNPAI